MEYPSGYMSDRLGYRFSLTLARYGEEKIAVFDRWQACFER